MKDSHVNVKNLVVRKCKQINDRPYYDKLDYSHDGVDLVDIGMPALKYGVLDLLLSDDYTTRARARRVLIGITVKEFGFVVGRGWSHPENEEQWGRLWVENGAYEANLPRGQLLVSHRKWVAWVRNYRGSDQRYNGR